MIEELEGEEKVKKWKHEDLIRNAKIKGKELALRLAEYYNAGLETGEEMKYQHNLLE